MSFFGFAIKRLPGPLLFLAAPVISWSQVDGALVTRHGALVQGTVQGNFTALDGSAVVTVERGAIVTGDFVLPADKTPPATGGLTPGNLGFGKLKVSAQTSVTIGDPASVKGSQRISLGFDLPRMQTPQQPVGTGVLVVQTDQGDQPDFTNVRDLTLNSPKRDVAVPPGVYGNLFVQSGRVLLGRRSPLERDRYQFQSLSVGPNGNVDLLGPVVVTVGQLGSIQGQLGNAQFTNWLDLRVSSGDIVLGSDTTIRGVVTAANSVVTMGQRTTLRGGLVCDRAIVGATASFTGVAPSWSKESSGNSLPLFIHKAARVQSGLADLAARHADSYTPTTDYANDEPSVTLTQITTTASRFEQHEERRAFFDACCTLLDGTGFARGTLILVRRPDTPFGPATIQVTMDSGQFEDHLRAIGRQEQLRDNIRLIRDDALLLNLFMERSLLMARNSNGVRQ